MPFLAAAAPAITALSAAGGAAAAGYGAYKSGKAAGNSKDLIADQRALYQKQTGLADLLTRNYGRQFSMGEPTASKGFSYYQTLMGNNRPAIQSLVGPETSMLGELYKGQEKGLARSGMRGGELEQAKAELGRQKTWQMADLIPKYRQDAMKTGTSYGLQAMSPESASAAGTALGGAGLTGASTLNSVIDQERQSQNMWSSLGGSIMRMLLPYLLNTTPSAAKSSTGAKSAMGYNGSAAGSPYGIPFNMFNKGIGE